MEPRIQYAKTADGVSIAYSTLGEGPPLVRLAQPGSAHVQREWEMDPESFQMMARAFRLIWYDPRGSGLSDRDAIDFSMEAMILDLETVVNRLGLDRFALGALNAMALVAVTYAVRRPDRVSHLILYNGWTKFSDYSDSPGRMAVEALSDKDWTLFTDTIARVLAGWLGWFDDPQRVEAYGGHMRACIEQEAYRAFAFAVRSYDVSSLLHNVRVPTLVVHNASNRIIMARGCQRLAAGIPGARFLTMNNLNMERVAGLVGEFLGTSEKLGSARPAAFRTVLFTDLVGHTEMMSRLGDAGGREVLREHERITREVLRAHGGTEVKTMGDGFMASFGSVTKAVECAVALQRAMEERSKEQGAGSKGTEPLSVRVGLNAGEPLEEDGDLFGATVIIAARIAAKAEGGEILVANAVRELCAGKGFLFAARGEFVAKGFEEPVRVYEVRWRE